MSDIISLSIVLYFFGMLIFAFICDLIYNIWKDVSRYRIAFYLTTWPIYSIVVPMWRAIKYIANRFYYTNW